MTTSSGGWNIAYSSSSFGISLDNVIQALSIDNTGLITIPQGISGYSTTNQLNSLITNSLTIYTTSSNLASNYVSNTSLSNTISNLNTVNVTNASWCRYQAINNSTSISIPASTSLLVLNCTYTGDVTITFNQAISNYCQSGISVFFTGTSPACWMLTNTNENILLYDQTLEQYLVV